MMRTTYLAAIAFSAAAVAVSAHAASISMGNLVVVQAGDGISGLSGTAAASFVKEYTIGGSLVQTLNLPTATSGANRALTLQGSATSEGFIKLSTNGQYLTVAGYDAIPGASAPASATAATVNRVVGRIDMAGNIDTTTALTDAYNGSNIRSVFSTNGTDIWTGGNAGSGQGATGGVRYLTHGGSTSVRVNTAAGTGSNSRVVSVDFGQLYASASSSPRLAIQQIGTGTPTAAGETETTLPGMPITGTHSAYDYFFASPTVCYIADDGSATNGGGIQKWVLSSGTWSLAYTLLNDGATATAARGLTGYVDSLGNTVLFATTTQSSANNLITVTDAGVDVDVATVIATAPTSTAFRGVEYIVPEPASFGMLAIAGLGLLARRAKR